MNLATLRDMAELWGYQCDQSGDVLKVQESPEDYCLIRQTAGIFLVGVYDTPATLLRDLGDYFVGTKSRANFTMKSPSTKQRKYGK